MKVITVASDLSNKGFTDFLKPSCEFYDLDATVLEHNDVFLSNRLKDALLNVYLEDVGDQEIIFFTDATDAIFLADENEILVKFKSFNSPLVFSAEINCWPDRILEKEYPGPSSHFRFLNSGAFIGRAGYIKELYQKYPIFDAMDNPRYYWSNQYYWNVIFKAEWPNIQLDYNCEIFYNTAIPIIGDLEEFKKQIQNSETVKVMFNDEKKRLNDEIVFTDGRIKSLITNSHPCHLHFPGPVSKLLMEYGYFDSLKKASKGLHNN